ncbi:hypothetical protein SC127_06745 [Pantoea sp. T14]|uniref:hypothetical protein n=1 Tax=Pantoea TaxID=53335 RepID=UPI002FC85CCB
MKEKQYAGQIYQCWRALRVHIAHTVSQNVRIAGKQQAENIREQAAWVFDPLHMQVEKMKGISQQTRLLLSVAHNEEREHGPDRPTTPQDARTAYFIPAANLAASTQATAIRRRGGTTNGFRRVIPLT